MTWPTDELYVALKERKRKLKMMQNMIFPKTNKLYPIGEYKEILDVILDKTEQEEEAYDDRTTGKGVRCISSELPDSFEIFGKKTTIESELNTDLEINVPEYYFKQLLKAGLVRVDVNLNKPRREQKFLIAKYKYDPILGAIFEDKTHAPESFSKP